MAATARPPSKSEVLKDLADSTGLSKKQVAALFEGLSDLIRKELKKKKPFTIPGVVKLKLVQKKAQPARKGRNPFTGEEMMFKAKPARNVVRAAPLKALKDSVN